MTHVPTITVGHVIEYRTSAVSGRTKAYCSCQRLNGTWSHHRQNVEAQAQAHLAQHATLIPGD